MTMKHYPASISIVIIWLALLSFRPVFAIGWPELVILLVIITILLGPVLLRIYRVLDKIRKAGKD